MDNLYDRIWEAYRLWFLEVNSRCYSCGVPATVVDHLRPHQGNEALFQKTDNHIPLCKKCHDTVTGLFDAKFKAGSSINDKLTWLAWTRARNELSFKVKVLPRYGAG